MRATRVLPNLVVCGWIYLISEGVPNWHTLNYLLGATGVGPYLAVLLCGSYIEVIEGGGLYILVDGRSVLRGCYESLD